MSVVLRSVTTKLIRHVWSWTAVVQMTLIYAPWLFNLSGPEASGFLKYFFSAQVSNFSSERPPKIRRLGLRFRV